jgi:hypothetical protein
MNLGESVAAEARLLLALGAVFAGASRVTISPAFLSPFELPGRRSEFVEQIVHNRAS